MGKGLILGGIVMVVDTVALLPTAMPSFILAT